jgi:integrase
MRKGELFGLRKADVDLAHRAILVGRSYDRDTTKGGHADALPIAPPLVPFLEAAMESPGEMVFPWPDGRMRSPEADPQKILRTALARAGLVVGYVHSCRRCRARGSAHEERHGDGTRRHCRVCGMALWPRAIPRPLRFHDLRHTTATLLLRAGSTRTACSASCATATCGRRSGLMHLDVEDLRSAVATLPSDVGGSAPSVRTDDSRRGAAGEFVTGLLPAELKHEKAKGRSSGFPLERPALQMEREKGFEPSTLALARRCSTTELFPQEAA